MKRGLYVSPAPGAVRVVVVDEEAGTEVLLTLDEAEQFTVALTLALLTAREPSGCGACPACLSRKQDAAGKVREVLS